MFAKNIVIIFGFMFNETQPPETTLIKLNGENIAPMVGERLEIGGRDGRSCWRNPQAEFRYSHFPGKTGEKSFQIN